MFIIHSFHYILLTAREKRLSVRLLPPRQRSRQRVSQRPAQRRGSDTGRDARGVCMWPAVRQREREREHEGATAKAVRVQSEIERVCVWKKT